MGVLSVKDLFAYFYKEMQKGHSDYIVFVTDDEEANGYHALFYLGSTAKECTKENRKYFEDNNHDICVLKNKDKAIYIG